MADKLERPVAAFVGWTQEPDEVRAREAMTAGLFNDGRGWAVDGEWGERTKGEYIGRRTINDIEVEVWFCKKDQAQMKLTRIRAFPAPDPLEPFWKAVDDAKHDDDGPVLYMIDRVAEVKPEWVAPLWWLVENRVGPAPPLQSRFDSWDAHWNWFDNFWPAHGFHNGVWNEERHALGAEAHQFYDNLHETHPHGTGVYGSRSAAYKDFCRVWADWVALGRDPHDVLKKG